MTDIKFFSKTKIFLLITFVIMSVFAFGKIKAGTDDDVSGWAWSENIGWISFNCTDLGTCGTVDYGVDIDGSGLFSGYAWSENIGWITFNQGELSGCPIEPCEARLDFGGTDELSGWARALSYGGGWEGWIRLRNTDYGVYRNPSTNELEDWAWSDEVMGWISFNCNNEGSCATSDYAVTLFGGDTTPPTVSVVCPASCTGSCSCVGFDSGVWQGEDSEAAVLCSSADCSSDPNDYKLITYDYDFYPSGPPGGQCPTDFSSYTLSNPQTVNDSVWVCGAALDEAGNPGFSDPVQYWVDQTKPSSQILSPITGWWYGDDFTIDAWDEDQADLSGLDTNECEYMIVSIAPDDSQETIGYEARTCMSTQNITVGAGEQCHYESHGISENDAGCWVYIKSKDNVGNEHTPSKYSSIRYYHIDWTPPTVGKIYITETDPDPNYPDPIQVYEGLEYTFRSHVTDNLYIAGCYLYIDGVLLNGTGVMEKVSPCTNDCVYATTTTMTLSGPAIYNNNYVRCTDMTSNWTSGESVDIEVIQNFDPQITEGPTASTTPPTGGDQGFDYCITPTTQPNCDVYFGVAAIEPDGDSLRYTWNFGDGSLPVEGVYVSHHYLAADPSYTVTVTVDDYKGGTDAGVINVEVTVPDLFVDLCVGLDADAVCYEDSVTFSKPANDVDLRADVSGTMYGEINYKFDCTDDGTWELEDPVDGKRTESYTAYDICDYPPGPSIIEVDGTPSVNQITDGSTITIGHTASGQDRLMLVGVSINNDNYEEVIGVTWNDTENFTFVDSIANSDDARVEIWRLIAPSDVSADVVVTLNDNINREAIAGVMTFTGVDQDTPLGTPNSISWTDSPQEPSITVASEQGDLIFGVIGTEYVNITGVGAGQTEHWNLRIGGTNTAGSGTTKPGDPLTTEISWILSSGDHAAISAVAIKPAPTPNIYTARVLVERGSGVTPPEDTVIITLIENDRPVLSWVGVSGSPWENDGINPDNGESDTSFEYRVKYTDSDDPSGDAPNFGYPIVHIKKGGVEIAGSPFVMSPLDPFDTNYKDGAIYYYIVPVPPGLAYGFDYTYYFDAQDINGLNATPFPISERSGPNVNNAPTAAMHGDASTCVGADWLSDPWITYNYNCPFNIINDSTDPDNDIVTSEWSIFYQAGGDAVVNPYTDCPNDDIGTPENEGLCDTTLPSVLTSGQSYYIELTVEDSGSLTNAATHDFYVRQDITASFSCSLSPDGPWQGCEGFRISEGQVVYFQDSSSPSEGGGSIISRDWIFTDGTPDSSTEQNPSVTFESLSGSSGTVTLEVRDQTAGVGRTDSETHRLQLTAPLPEWREVPPR